MSSTALVPVLDNNYPPKARGAFYFLVSTRGIFFVSVTYVRLRLLLAFSKNVRKLLSRSGTRALRDNNYPNKWRAHLFEAELPYFLTSLLPYFFTSLLPYSFTSPRPYGPKCFATAAELPEQRPRSEGLARSSIAIYFPQSLRSNTRL